MAQWVHLHVSLEEMTEFAAGFLELLVLASGLQSSGEPFPWTIDNLRKALGWASTLEKAMAELPSSADGVESRKALDAALAELMASAPALPPGLPRLTADNLSNARRLLLGTLLQAVQPNAMHFASIVDSLAVLNESEGDLWGIVKDEVCARHCALRSVESLHMFVGAAFKELIPERKQSSSSTSIWQMGPSCARDTKNSARVVIDDDIYATWAKSSVEYVISFTTVSKVAAATLIFEASPTQWRDVLDTVQALPLKPEHNGRVDNGSEIAELCCLQLASPNWKELASKILAFWSGEKLADGAAAESSHAGGGEEPASSEPEGGASVEAYLMEVLERRAELWWDLPPVLLAAACAARLLLLKAYLQTVTQAVEANGRRMCKCAGGGSRSEDCDRGRRCSYSLLERLWCLRVHRPHLGALDALQIDGMWAHLVS